MFIFVKVPDLKCPLCNETIEANSEWQSKDCEEENMCIVVDYKTTQNFYRDCPHCKKWVEFKKKTPIKGLEDFEPDHEQMKLMED